MFVDFRKYFRLFGFRVLRPVANMLASVANLLMPPPANGLFDLPFVRTLRPVARVPASAVDTVIPPCTNAFRWWRSSL